MWIHGGKFHPWFPMSFVCFHSDANEWVCIDQVLYLMHHCPGWLGVGLNHVSDLSLRREMILFDHIFFTGWNKQLVECRNDSWHHIDNCWGLNPCALRRAIRIYKELTTGSIQVATSIRSFCHFVYYIVVLDVPVFPFVMSIVPPLSSWYEEKQAKNMSRILKNTCTFDLGFEKLQFHQGVSKK